ncbi:glycosyltransferase [Arthrobacter globiformis]|uniref:glycosyltransferase n=1 Tax=Arthrobacter globiformis TaxID=1665 RepID=UPI000B41D273|nr:glycosyltransferase [Arthrobacter globiformis]
MNIYGTPRIVVSLGTDYHTFDRLVTWMDGWLEQQPAPPTCLVQHGASRAPHCAPGVTMVSHEEILDLYAGAEIIVVQGGPGSIIDALSTGHVPIAVPRRAALHEVVDDHQVEFARQMERQGQAVVAETKESLWAELEHALREPGDFCTAPRPSGSVEAALRLGRAVEELQKAPAGIVSMRRIRHLLAHH